MKNIAINSSNNRFFKVQEEVKNLLSIIMGVVEVSAEEEQDFEYFSQNATSQEDQKQIQELKKSTELLNKKAKSYQENVGRATPQKPSSTPTQATTFNEIKPFIPQSIEHTHSIDDISNDSIDDISNER